LLILQVIALKKQVATKDMIGLKEQFSTKSAEQWLADLSKELKEEDFQRLSRRNELEGLEESAINHADVLLKSISSKGLASSASSRPFDQTVGNGVHILLQDENEANKIALELLMKGADYLVFDFTNAHQSINLKKLFEGIQFEYIYAKFIPTTAMQVKEIFHFFGGRLPQKCGFGYDHFSRNEETLFQELLKQARNAQFPFLEVNGFGVQQLGANCQQELTFSLSVAHEYLVLLMENGLSVDEASACIHFHSGIGSSFFYEIAKFRALRLLYAHMIVAYKPEHGCSSNCLVGASIGNMNKSFLDQDTNLLRKTTEVLSAVSAGVDYIISHEIQHRESDQQTSMYQRMSRNILPILQNESKLVNLIDPVGGSYLVETHTDKLCEAAWKNFQNIEVQGGISQPKALLIFLQQKLLPTREKRIRRLLSGADQYIGINTLRLEEKSEVHPPSDIQYLGIPYLSLENEFNKPA
jgi:methylmalonyl-CoA mutase